MASLGVGDYEVSIVFSSDPTQTIQVMPFSQLTWQRTINSPSQASFTIPGADGGIEACGTFGGLRPWDHMMVVERDGYTVWDGPILGWRRGDNGDVTINASDRSILFSKTLVGATRNYPANSTSFQDIMTSIIAAADFRNPPFPLTFDLAFGVNFALPNPAEVDLHVERLDNLASVWSQIAESTDMFWTCRSDLVQFCEHKVRGGLTPEGIAGIYALGYDNNWLTLSESTVIGLPVVAVDGAGLATRPYLGGASSGSSGHAIIVPVDLRTAVWYVQNGDPPPFILSTLQSGTANLSQSDTASVATAAERLAVDVSTPNLTIEQLQLSPDFGGPALLPSLDNLLPGTRFNLGFEETCAFSVPTARYAYVYTPPNAPPAGPGHQLGTVIPVGAYDYALAWAGDTVHVRLEQLDVTVDDTGEKVMGSFAPTVEIVTAPAVVTHPGAPTGSRGIVY